MDPDLPISISAGDFFRMSQRISTLDKARIALHSENISLKNRCGVLEAENVMLNNSYSALQNEIAAQVQARMVSDRTAEELRSRLTRLDQEREGLRATAVTTQLVEAKRTSNPASAPLRIVSVGIGRTEMAVDDEFSVLPANATDKGPASPGRYPDEIPEKDRDAIRTRMLRDRGRNGAAPASPLCGLEEASRAPWSVPSEGISGDTTPASPQGELAEAPLPVPAEDTSGTGAPASPQGELGEAPISVPAAIPGPSRDGEILLNVLRCLENDTSTAYFSFGALFLNPSPIFVDSC